MILSFVSIVFVLSVIILPIISVQEQKRKEKQIKYSFETSSNDRKKINVQDAVFAKENNITHEKRLTNS